jgi:hypothetical protein
MSELVYVTASKDATVREMPVSGGLVSPETQTDLKRFITALAKGGAFPKRFENFEQQLAAYNLARSLMGDKWQLAINNIASIHGQMMIYGELPRALAESTGQVEDIDTYVVDSEYNRICVKNKNLGNMPYAGVCDIKRSGRKEKQFVWTIEQAKQAGQYPAKDYSPWMKFTDVMLMRKAQALAIKLEFSDAVSGLPIAEYEKDVALDLHDQRDVTDGKVSDFNAKINELTEAKSV